MGPENAVWGIAMMLVSQVYMAQEKNQRQFATPTIGRLCRSQLWQKPGR